MEPSRVAEVEEIAAMAGLRVEEIPYFALKMEPIVRLAARWHFTIVDKSFKYVQDIRRCIPTDAMTIMISTGIIIVGLGCILNARYTGPVGWLFLLIVLINAASIIQWVDGA